MRLKTIKLVYTEELIPLISELANKINFDTFSYSSSAAYIQVQVLGITLGKELVGQGYKPHYNYNLMLFRTQDDLDKYNNNAGRLAKNLITKFVKEPQEPYVEKVTRPSDFLISNAFKENTSYTGHWVEIDMNSAEPYYVAKALPTLKASIYQRYAMRKNNPTNKQILNAINGNLRNMYPSKYLEVCNAVYDKMLEVMNTLSEYGIVPFALRRDGVLALLPMADYPIPREIPVSDKIGDFKVVRDYGTVQTSTSEYVYLTDMTKIHSKQLGVVTPSPLDRVIIMANPILGIGLLIKEN